MLELRSLVSMPVGEAPISDVSLRVDGGEIVAVAGPNGAGKSTLCRCLAGLLRPSAGCIWLDGKPLGREPFEVARAGLVVVLKGQRVFPDLSVRENLLVSPRTWARNGRDRRLRQVLELFPRLADRLGQPAGTLSGGEQQMVAIGRSLVSAPRVLALDEPSFGLAPRIVADVYTALRSFRASGGAVLLTEDNPDRVQAIADRAYYLVGGRIVDRGRPSELQERLLVRRSLARSEPSSSDGAQSTQTERTSELAC